MVIFYNKSQNIFHLQAKDTSYVIKILKSGHLGHVYWGAQIKKDRDLSHLIRHKERILEPYLSPEDEEFHDESYSLDMIPQEYPAYGHTDYRQPAYHVELENGSRISDLRYQSHKIKQGKEELAGLPATYVEDENEAETLKIKLKDEVTNLEVVLSYTVYEKFSAITRSAKFINKGQENINLNRVLSASVDFNEADFELLQLSGSWSRERHLKRRELEHGIQSIESTRGASSPYQNPFLALVNKNTTEEQGQAYGFSLVYSGNFLGQVQVNHFDQTRVNLGINPFDFNWLLEPTDSFQTPEVVMVYSNKGLNQMSQTYHKLYRTRLARGKYRDKVRPILVNNWEATYFDFNEDKLLDLAETASELGVELFVLDDGWFGKRDDDRSSLGDWFVDERKLPNGLDSLGNKIEELDMDFGLWFEPEMISPDSELYRTHPDWCIHVPERGRSRGRHQLILDLSRKEVQDKLITMLSDILENAPISYVKWDMNRHMTEIGSADLPPERQKELPHRYILGLYRILEELTTKFSDILFESCASGGGRFDPGMLYYMPQTWTSDDTDAVERLKIQYGTSIVYPLSSMGAHVSAVPNHQTGRITSLDMRGDVAKFGMFGYELDLTEMTDEEKEIIKEQIADYKEIRELIQTGEFYRLISPFTGEGNMTAWMVVAEDKSEAYVGCYRVLAKPNPKFYNLELKGLDPEQKYQIVGSDEIHGGDELMYAGLNLPAMFNGIDLSNMKGDFQSYVWRLKVI